MSVASYINTTVEWNILKFLEKVDFIWYFLNSLEACQLLLSFFLFQKLYDIFERKSSKRISEISGNAISRTSTMLTNIFSSFRIRHKMFTRIKRFFPCEKRKIHNTISSKSVKQNSPDMKGLIRSMKPQYVFGFTLPNRTSIFVIFMGGKR